MQKVIVIIDSVVCKYHTDCFETATLIEAEYCFKHLHIVTYITTAKSMRFKNSSSVKITTAIDNSYAVAINVEALTSDCDEIKLKMR